ncbi:30S ribosomal protein S18, chloroplastic [Hondaea fermentalgiana]|uniref:30S ribosomal protein S18, chloroplastic n=1 Tax=Hondaea fermentalgiana TaxID=2315210 RepID=A0A2R5GHT6_9STRA|nr:30S ribosomal protein S18, chloroplastic [Hondaea fermentalgiana]|eukprot:GBG30456.1 30S ribosomal protein S18, chloroplastic [Hondaea fermentalgiana]
MILLKVDGSSKSRLPKFMTTLQSTARAAQLRLSLMHAVPARSATAFFSTSTPSTPGGDKGGEDGGSGNKGDDKQQKAANSFEMDAVSEDDLLNSFSGNLVRKGFVPVDEERVREVMGKPPREGSSGRSPVPAPRADTRPLSTPADIKELFVERLQRSEFKPGSTFDPVSFMEGRDNMQNVSNRRFAARTPRPARLERTGQEIHFTNLWFLSRFMSPMGKILPRYKTGLSKKKQRNIGRAIRRARQMGLMSYFHRYVPGILERTEGEAEPTQLAPPTPPSRNNNTGGNGNGGRSSRRKR